MAVATIPKLGATTLPPPSEQDYTTEYRGGSLQMADGSIVIDLVDATARYRFMLRWKLLTKTQKDALLTAYATIKNTTAVYTSIENTTHTVTRPDGGAPKITPVVTAGGDIKYNVEFDLIEDS